MGEENNLRKFIRFTKVNSQTREVSGVVTGEAPDKDREVCDYDKSKPFYEAVISEMGKATDGMNFFPLREMHGLNAAGKCIGFHFNDSEKEIEMTFKVVDDKAWNKVEERVYTGFSQGGRKVGDQIPDPVYKGCMRYVANPSEVSLVDNPCYAGAHFQYVKADGTIELRKFLRIENPAEDPREQRVAALEEQVATLQKAVAAAAAPATEKVVAITDVAKEAKTKRVAGKDLHASDFAYVGDPDKTETWKLPVHDAAHARNALARFNQAKDIPASEKGKVRAKIVAAAKKFGVEVSSEEGKKAAISETIRKAARVYVNRNREHIVSPSLLNLDLELGKLRKGMYEVSNMAQLIDSTAWLMYAVSNEQEYENDEESALPQMLADNVTSLTETFLAMADEETRELLEQVRQQAAA